MKKLIGTAMLAALLATSAFAEGFTIGAGWLNSNYVIGSDDGDNVVSGFGMPWGMGGARWASFNVGGDSEYAGFLGEVQINNGGTVAIGQAFTYVKPIEWVQLIFGNTDQNYLRGDNCMEQFAYWRPGAFAMGEGHIFDEFEVKGVGVLVTPMDALKIFAGYNVDLAGETGNLHEQIGRTGSLGAAYTIGDIGTVKAGLWAQGKKADDKDGKDKKDRVLVEAAFELTAIEGVFIGVGAKIPLGGAYNEYAFEVDKDKKATKNKYASEPIQVNAGVALNLIENLGIQLNVGTKINAPQVKDPLADSKNDGQFGFAVALGVDYAFAESWKVFGSVGYASDVYNASYSAYWDSDASASKFDYTTKDTLTFGVGVAKTWSNALLGIEFVGMTNDSSYLVKHAHNDTAFNWAIPIKMNVSF